MGNTIVTDTARRQHLLCGLPPSWSYRNTSVPCSFSVVGTLGPVWPGTHFYTMPEMRHTFLWEFSWRSKSFSLLTILACTALTRLCDLCKSTTDSGTLTQTSVFNAHVRAVSHNAPANHSPPASVRTHVHLPPADRHLTSGSIYKISHDYLTSNLQNILQRMESFS